MTQAELLERVSIQELQEWMVLEQIEPFGEAANYQRNALLLATMCNLTRGKSQPAFKPEKFMPDLYGGGRRRERTVKEHYHYLLMLQKEQAEIIAGKELRAKLAKEKHGSTGRDRPARSQTKQA